MATRGYIQFPKPFPVPLTLQGANLAGQQLAGGLGTRKGARLGAFQELLLEPVSERQGKPVEKITWSFPESWISQLDGFCLGNWNEMDDDWGY